VSLELSIPRGTWFEIQGAPARVLVEVWRGAGGLIHDVLYGARLCPWATADLMLHDVIDRTRGYCPGWRLALHSHLFWAAVRAGGWWPWFRKTNAIVKEQRTMLTWWSREFLRTVKADWESKQCEMEGMAR